MSRLLLSLALFAVAGTADLSAQTHPRRFFSTSPRTRRSGPVTPGVVLRWGMSPRHGVVGPADGIEDDDDPDEVTGCKRRAEAHGHLVLPSKSRAALLATRQRQTADFSSPATLPLIYLFCVLLI